MPTLIKKPGILSVRIAPLVLISLLLLTGGLSMLRDAQAFPTNPTILDNFNRSDSTSLAASSASGPYNWNTTQAINNPFPTGLGISSNQLYEAGVSANNAYIDHVFGPDTEISLDAPVPASNGFYVALWARIQQPGSAAFDSYALVYINNGANAVWSLRRYDDSAGTHLADINGPSISPGDSLGLSVTGTGGTVTLTAYQKSGGVWTSIGSVNDTSSNRITSGGYVGIEIGDNFPAKYDNFAGGDVITNTAPGAPDLVSPSNNATGVSTTPQLKLRSTDADDDDLQYKIEICADASCSTVIRTIDQSASQVGWSGQDKGGGTAYTGGATLPDSTIATHDYQLAALAYSTQYWWRAYAIDPSGTNTFSPASAISSFTTESAPSQGGNPGSGNSGSGQNTSQGNNSAITLDKDLTPQNYTSAVGK